MSRLKKEILGKLKEYAGKMGKDHLGGNDIESPRRGGLRDFDGYDNVDYNKDMPMDEMQVVNKKTGKDITKHVLALLSGKIDKKKFEKLTGLKKESVTENRFSKKPEVTSQQLSKIQSDVRKINRKIKVYISKHPITKGELSIELGAGHDNDSEIDKIYKVLKKHTGTHRTGTMFNESVNEAYIVLHSPKKGVKPVTTAAYKDKKDAEKWAKYLGGITMIVKKKVKGIDEDINEASVETERYFGKKGIIIMIRDGNKMISAIFKDKKNADKFNRNKPADVKKLIQLAKKTKYPKAIDESVNEATFRPNSGTMSGGTYGLDNRKYQLKRDVKGVRIGDYTNVILPKGTIIYNIPGGVFAHHDVLAAYQSGQNKYFNKPTFKGISIRREKSTILSIEKNSKILESVNEINTSVNKRRAGAELKQKLKGKRSDGMGKYTATIYGLDSKGKRVELKSLNDLNKYSKFELDESVNEGMFSTIDQIRQDSKDVRDFVKNVFKDREFKKMSNDKDFIKYLKSIYEGMDESKGVPSNYMSGRTSDYHTALRGKNRDYSGGTNFKKKNHGQPDVEEDDEDQETNQLSNKQIHVKAKLKVAESGKKKSKKNYKDWKSTNEGFDKVEHLSLLNQALRAISGSQKQKDIIRKLNVVRKAGGMRPLKELSIVEYGQRLDLSFIEDEEAKLDGTYPSTDAIDRDIDETAKRDYKDEYKKFQSSKKSKKYRAELNKYNRDKGTYGNGDGKDASHKGGKIVGFESASKNRGRKEKSRLKKENVAPNHNGKSAPHGSGYKKVNEVGVFNVSNYIKGIIPHSRLDTNTPEAKKKSKQLMKNLHSMLNQFWRENDIPYRARLR